jgi:hypothetical protein
MAYFADIKHIFLAEPNMVDVNAKEYERFARLVESTVRPEITAAQGKLDWAGASRDQFDTRVTEAHSFLGHLAGGITSAADALNVYVPKLTDAKRVVQDGRNVSHELRKAMRPYRWLPRDVSDGGEDPLRYWEMLRPVVEAQAQTGLPASRTKAAAVLRQCPPLYEKAKQLFDTAKQTEEQARAACVPALRKAYELLPDYRVDPALSTSVTSSNPHLPGEVAEAAGDPDVRLSGTGTAPPHTDATPTGPVSPALADIRADAARVPGGHLPWDWDDKERWDQRPHELNAFREQWITHNKEVIKAAAEKYGVPADLVGAVAYEEIGGSPLSYDETVRSRRENWPTALLDLHDGGRAASLPPDYTSMGAIDMQIRRAADTLGYDATALTEPQRTEILNSMRDAREQVFIATKHLADLKQAAGYGLIDPTALTDDQLREIAVRYSKGPYWQDHLTGMGGVYGGHLNVVRNHRLLD